MGSAVVNALSDLFIAEVAADGKLYQVKFEKGVFTQRQTVVKNDLPKDAHGTTIKYKLDKTMFDGDIELDHQAVLNMCQQMTFLNNGLRIEVVIQTEDKIIQENFISENGLKDYLDLLVKDKKLAIDTQIHLSKHVPAKALPRDLNYDLSFVYTTGYEQNIISFVNSIPSEDGGSHVQGITQGLCNALRKYGLEKKAIKTESDFEINDCARGLLAIISVRYKKPTFDRQSKTKLNMPKVKNIIATAITEEFCDFLERNPSEAKIILEKAILARKERIAIKNKREEIRGNKNKNDKLITSGKLVDCSSNKPEECELFIVEGLNS